MTYPEYGITLRLKKGDQIFYRTSQNPKHVQIIIENNKDLFMKKALGSENWMILEFSNTLLPDEFLVHIKTDNKNEWAMIGVSNK